MGKGLKVITILIFLSTLGVLYFSSKIITELIAKREKVKNLTLQVKSLEDERDKLIAQVDSLTQANDKLERDLASLRRERDRLVSDLNNEKRKVRDLNSRIAALNREKSSLQSQVYSLQGKVQDVNQQLARLEEERSRWEDAAKKAEKQVNTLKKQLAQYTGEIEQGKSGTKLVPEIVKKATGTVLDFRSPGIIAVKFTGSVPITPGTTLYAFRKDKVIGKITVREVYSTLVVAKTDYENLGESLSRNDVLKITRWVSEKEGGE
ncbi:MAG: hypothetical protein GXO71_00245 [Caldiserica bacterium]|nr:hypothetical protein [Caldisericota bacterium]